MKLVSAKTFQKLGSHPAWLPLNRKVECWICCLPQLYRQVAGVCLNDSNIFWRTCHSSIPPWSHPKILGLQVIDMLLSWKHCPINGITSSNVRIFRRNTETSFEYYIWYLHLKIEHLGLRFPHPLVLQIPCFWFGVFFGYPFNPQPKNQINSPTWSPEIPSRHRFTSTWSDLASLSKTWPKFSPSKIGLWPQKGGRGTPK